MHAILHLLLNIEETFCMPIIFSDLSFNSPKNSATKSEFILFIEVDAQQNGDKATWIASLLDLQAIVLCPIYGLSRKCL